MPTDVGKYLASRYLVAEPEISSTKRKRKSAPNGAGIIFSENDDWGSGRQSVEQPDGNVEILPQLVHETTAEFRKSRKNNWKRLGTNNAADMDGVTNIVIAAAISEKKPRSVSNDELPVVANMPDVVEMADGTHAGLQTASAVSAQLERRTHEERAQFELHKRSAKENGTVYRDGTGRRVNLSTKQAEAKKIAADAADKETEVIQALRGKIQLEEAKKRTEQLKDARFIPFARTADDENWNKDLKERARWDDPALHFRDEGKHRVAKARQGSVRRPFFTGAAPPNRYGIKPGYRWDGVDRGIGFEAGRFRAINRRDALRNLDYSWQLDE
ncbi:hypothetical protein E4U57_007384 [Claviceps arundinis]|uniref:Pre-mRNA-splicing factor CWC26 n=1 Tax=Claviceps arundinis TaxID=1623583 RepID=A0A9P7SKA0_9HYPO|nr:hypothetical protein E4U57_007384 [Claviceps arundinis]KAG5955962.1 hypothetical protein E4U56_006830 [Claviceps arundinis]